MINLVVVESPTKARTLSKFLGDKYQIEASYGHVRDLPKSEMGIDIEHNFTPRYIIPRAKQKSIKSLAKLISEARTLWLATDPDREGEAIAWHLSELMANSQRQMEKSKAKSRKPDAESPQRIQRVVFHEITPTAIEEAFANPRQIDMKLVNAQQARRVLDRLVGYKLSPLLWKKVKSGLSAGRVQSVALRLIVEREEEIKAFKAVEYWSIQAELEAESGKRKAESFKSTVVELNGKKLEIKNKQEADGHVQNLEKAKYRVSDTNKREVRRYPAPPFTTSTLQQAAVNHLGFSAKKTMMLAQNLYEQGLITYMRTDSVNLAPVALDAARELIGKNYGSSYLPAKPRQFRARSKLVQEAHEAIRPTDVRIKNQELRIKEGITRDHMRLYDLIWKKVVASQMAEAVVNQTTVGVSAKAANGTRQMAYALRATGSVVRFDGWLAVYGVRAESGKRKAESEDQDEDAAPEENVLPELTKDQALEMRQLLPEQHFTEPPPRFNEASLIKKLEELSIGRPSTYAPTLATIMERYYVERLERRLHPTQLGTAVIKFLKEYFLDIIDYSFTAEMEESLDAVAEGAADWVPLISDFYAPFAKKVEAVSESATRVVIETETVEERCPNCGKQLMVKFGRFGKFLACSGYPECKFTKNFTQKININCPKCGGDVILRKTKKGRPFFGCSNYPKCDFASWTKPKPDKSGKGKAESEDDTETPS